MKTHGEAPLSPEALAALKPIAATQPRSVPRASPTTTTLYYTSRAGASIEPRTHVEPVTSGDRSASLWKVTIEVDGATSPYLPGLHSQALPRPRSKTRARHSLNGFRPAWHGVSFVPKTEPRRAPRRIKGARGRTYVPLVVFPDDSRVVLTDTSWPWCCIGRIETSDGGVGTAALVGDRVALTAQHMRPEKSIADGHWWIKFVPLYFDGTAQLGVSSFVSDTHWYTRDDTDFNVSHDYMALRLYEPLGQQLGYFGTNTFADDWRGLRVFTGVGYPIDIGGSKRPVVQFNWWMEDDYEDDDGQILETEASLEHGESGGPFFAWWPNNDPRIVGVVAAGGSFGDDRDNALGGGPNLVDLVDWARANWPA
jgi:V8-like Glu-specific endopeptidase